MPRYLKLTPPFGTHAHIKPRITQMAGLTIGMPIRVALWIPRLLTTVRLRMIIAA